MSSDFYTLTGYHRQEPERLTASMEDYLEMIFRYARLPLLKWLDISNWLAWLNLNHMEWYN